MKPKIIITIAIVLLLGGLTGCYKDILSPGQDPSAPPQAVSFSGDLVPLFTANCATAGCHDAVPAHRPSLTSANAYNAILGGGFVNTTVPANSIIYGEMKSGSMPPSGALRATDIQKVLDWIRNGAPNN
jgi:hypothetical protein